ncbi:MAG TPA: cytochrome c biogenesis protein CcdA [Candidatus Paceibacterota bacterium]
MKDLTRSIIILLAVVLAISVSFLFLNNFSGQGGIDNPVFLPVLISSALVDSVNPCAFSVLILTVAFLASLGTNRRKVLSIGGAYVLGIFTVYFLIGLGLLRALDFFGAPHVLGKIGAVILVLFGVSVILSYLFPSFPIKFKIPDFIHGRFAKLISKASLPATFFLGVLVALFEFPCTGGPYLLVLGLLHDQSTIGIGLIYLLLYNLIFILPLIAILLLASDPALINKAEQWKKNAAGKGKLIAGTAMVILALIIFLSN